MKALVTGAKGQLGRTVVRVLRDTYEVVGTARSDLDITDESAVRSAVRAAQPDVILNCAGYNKVDTAESEPDLALAINAFGVQSLAAAASDVDATLVHFSTDFVFDGETSTPYVETDAPNPQSVYATSKLLGEWFAAETPRHYVLRVASLFGGPAVFASGEPRRGSSLDFLASAMLEEREVRVFVDRTVSPSHVEDVTEATVSLLRLGLSAGLYHCVGSGSATWLEIATELALRFNVTPNMRQVTLDAADLPACRPKFCALSNRKLTNAGVVLPEWQDAVQRYANTRMGIVSAPSD